MIVLASCCTCFATYQLIVVFELIVIEGRGYLPGMRNIVQAQIEGSQAVVGLLILIVVFGTVEGVGTIALCSNAYLCPDVETLVVAKTNVAIALSLLEITVLRTSI